MGITYETPEQKQVLLDTIKNDMAKKHNIETVENNPLLDELAKTELSRRETQASYTRGQQALKEVEAQKGFLYEKLQSDLDLSIRQNEELETLKFEDPDKWLATLDTLKTKAKSDFDATISEGLSHVSSEASKNFALSTREEILKNFSEANPEVNLLDQSVRDQIPPVLLTQLESGVISSGDFLEKAKNFVIGNVNTAKKLDKDLKDNFKDLKGKQKLDSDDIKKDIFATYDTMTF